MHYRKVGCTVVKVKAGIKRRVEMTAAELGGITETATVHVPSMETIRKNIRKSFSARKK